MPPELKPPSKGTPPSRSSLATLLFVLGSLATVVISWSSLRSTRPAPAPVVVADPSARPLDAEPTPTPVDPAHMLVDSAEDEDDDWCHTTTDGGFPAPNETVHPPFALSASDAVWRLMSSVHYATLSRNHKLLGVSTDVGCARGCDPWRRECGYSLLIEVDRGGLEGVSSHLEYDYVGPFDGTVQFQIRSREKSRDLDDRKSLSDIAPRRRP